MVHQERLATGEKWFVFGTMLVLGVEGVLTIIHNALHFSWPGLFLGVFGFCFVMYLANRLYGGDRTAYNLALVWVGFELVYAVLVLSMLMCCEQGAATARSLGAPVIWGALLKGIAYGIYGGVLWRMPEVQDFFADKRGETPSAAMVPGAAAVTTEEPVVAAPLELPAAASEAVLDVASYVRKAAWALMVLGVLQILAGLTLYELPRAGAWLGLAEGIILLGLGAWTASPARQLRCLADKANQNTAEVASGLSALACHYKCHAAAVVALLLVWGARFFLP